MRRNFDRQRGTPQATPRGVSIQSFGEKEFRCSERNAENDPDPFQFSPSVRRNFDGQRRELGSQWRGVSIQSFGEKEFRLPGTLEDLAGRLVSIQSFGEKEFRFYLAMLGG